MENRKHKNSKFLKRIFRKGISGPRKSTVRVASIIKMIMIESFLFFSAWGYLHWKSPYWYGYNWWSIWILMLLDRFVNFIMLYYYLRHRGVDEV